ncbi:MAG: hypothetical protein ABJA02_07115 [Acidobacteriota bacterium]
MKKFFFSILCVAVFFVGLGALVDTVGAKFKSDERALELVKKARLAIGGDAAITSIKSLRIIGQTAKTLRNDGGERTENGETEIAMQLPDKLMKMTKLGDGDGTPGSEGRIRKQLDVVVVGDAKDAKQFTVTTDGNEPAGDGVRHVVIKNSDGTTQEINGDDTGKVIIRKVDGGNAVFSTDGDSTTEPGEKHVMIKRVGGGDMQAHHDGMRRNEMLKLTLGLLMSAPDGIDVDYQYGGETSVDGTECDAVIAGFGGNSYKIYLSRSTSLPVMMSYTGMQMPMIVKFRTTGDAKAGADSNDSVIINRKMGDPSATTAEVTVKFTDYRSVEGVQLPYKWTQTIGGAADETFDVSSYEINPANIADKFKDSKVFVRTEKPEVQ